MAKQTAITKQLKDVVNDALQVAQHEIRITTLEKSVGVFVDPEKGVIAQVAALKAMVAAYKWYMIAMNAILLYLVYLHIHP